MSQTIVICKPDVFDRIPRNPDYDTLRKPLPEAEVFLEYVKKCLESKGLQIGEQRRETMTVQRAGEHYLEHKNKPEQYSSLQTSMSRAPSHIMCLEGKNAQRLAREVIMDLRIEFLKTPKISRANMLHASGDEYWAKYEVDLHFPKQKKT